MKNLKLFVWEDVLSDYTSGVMFALAKDVEQARKVILDKYKKKYGLLHFEKTLQRDFASQPRVIDKAEGFYIWGGAMMDGHRQTQLSSYLECFIKECELIK